MTLSPLPPDDRPKEPGPRPDPDSRDAPTPLDAAAIKRLAAIDDQLAGLAAAGNDDEAGDAAITPELAERLDTLLLLRMVAARDAKPPAALSIGKFRVVHKLGEGGFAEVFEVIDTRLVRREALKIARPGILLDTSKTNRFLREAKYAAKISHPNVVIVHEVGEYDGLPYIAQELCGESLASWLDRHPGPVAPPIAARVVLALAEAAHAAHAVGVFHRDIKPGNVLLVPSEDGPLPPDDRLGSRQPGDAPVARGQRVKLGDFGLSTSVYSADHDSPSGPPTEFGTRLGTPEWMAPEQVDPKRGPMDARTDVHALGLVLDRLLTGRCVNASVSLDGIYRRVLEVEPEPADRVVPGIPPDLVAVCRKCLAKPPGQRYSSAAELAVDLSRFLDGRPTIARPLTPAQHAGRWLRRNPTLAGAIAAALTAVVLGGLVIEERARGIARDKDIEEKEVRAKEEETERRIATAEREAQERAEKAARDATRDLRRAFETYRIGNAVAAVADLRKSAAADPALADSIAGGWLLARTHGEIATLIDRGEKALPGNSDALQIHSLALSPKADLLAAGVADGTLVLLPLAADGTTAGMPREIDVGHEINQVAFSPDGEIVATAGKLRAEPDDEEAKEAKEKKNEPVDVGRVRLWNVADGSHRRDLELRGNEVFTVAFSPSGDRIAWGGTDRAIRCAAAGDVEADPLELRPFETARKTDGQQANPETLRNAEADIELIRFLDDQRVLVAIHNRVCVVDLASGRIEWAFMGEQGDVQAFSLSPDRERIVVGGWFEHMVRVWDLESGSLDFEIEGATQWIHGCEFSADGRWIVTGCKDSLIRVYDASTGDPVEELVGHLGRIWNVLYHPSGRILSAGGDGTVRLWEQGVGPLMRGANTITVPGLPSAEAVADLGDGRGLVVPRGGLPVIIDADGKTTRVDGIDVTKIYGVAVDRDRRRCAVADADRIAVLPMLADGNDFGPSLRVLPPSFSVAWGESGWLYAGKSEPDGMNGCWAWPPDLGDPSCIDGGHRGAIDSISISRGARPRLAFATGAVIRVHDLGPDGAPVAGKGRQLADLTDETGLWLRLAWSPDGARLAVGSAGGETMILDADTGSTAVDLGSFMEPVKGIVWADNGRSLIVAAEHCIRLIDASTGGTFDEIRPDWAVSDMTIIAGHDRRPYLVVTGNRSSLHRRNHVPKAGAPDDGRLLLLDLSRRLTADAARGQ
jgi:serine/threonine protein kinase/WD40 repeat protein